MFSQKQCLIELNISLLIMSVTTLFPKLIDLPVHYIIFGRSVIAACALYLYLKISRKKCFFPSAGRTYFTIILTGILLAIHWLSLFKSIQISSVSIGIISFFSYPVMTIFLEPFFFKNKLHFNDFLLSIFVIIGVCLILPDFELSNSATQGVMWGLLSAFFFALRNIISKEVLSVHSGEEVMMFQLMIAALFLLPTIIIFNTDTAVAYPSVVKIIVLGLFFTAIPHTLLIRSLAGLRPKTVSILSSLQPFYCVIIAVLFLNEIPTFKVIIGGLFIVSAVLFETFKCNKK